ncbi:hypothetical protein Tco_0292337 [Tanacetum coccineum]
MAQSQRQADVHQDQLCPHNKRCALMDANKKIDLENPLCPNESKILANILQNHLLRFSIVASSSMPWIYLGQFWHTLKEDGSKYKLSFVLDRKKLTMTLDDFRTIFHLPQATYNNHERFVPAPKFSEMVPFYINNLCLTLELRSPSNFKTTGLVQPWQTLCKMFSRCLTTRVTGYDGPPLQIMHMLYCFVNNIHVDYADLLWEGFHYSFEHPTTLIPYLRFTKLIVSHYMTAFPKILRRTCDKYHNLEDDEMVKSIFNSRKNKAGVEMKIRSWMITNEMKLTQNYRMYVAVFGVDVHTTQSQPIESTQGTHRTTSAPWTHNPDVAEGKSSASRKSTVIRLQENKVDSSTLRQNDNQNDPGTRLEPRSNKESPEVEITAAVHPVNVNEEEEESPEDDYELKRREKGSIKKFHDLAQHLQEVMKESLPKMVDTRVKELTKTQVPIYVAQCLIMERQQSQTNVAKMIADVIQQERKNLRAEISSQINNAISNHIPS